MPADPSHTPMNRRVNRKLASDEEIDSRRARGEISCAECRRLKLKCDRKLPCSSCVRRGCPSICPNGSLSTGQGTRFVLADTSQLHTKIAEMGQRIRQLEDALAIFQSGVSNECHPLLREELLSIKFGPEKGYVPEKETPVRRESMEPPIDAFGTMTIGDSGEAKYFGPSAGSETLFMAGAALAQSAGDDDYYAPVSLEIARLSASFPFGADGNVDKPLDFLFDHLPPEPRAWSLCETYMEQSTWAFRPLNREELIDEILSPIYKVVKQKQTTGSYTLHAVSAHKLAVMFLIFSVGALVDLTLQPCSKEADLYYHLGRGCLSLRSVFESPEISTVQAVLLMAYYHANAGKRYTMDSSWGLTSLGAKLAQSLGLHRDSSRWKMDAKTVQRRRGLFWELFSMELFYSLALGRPPSIRLSYVDTEFPDDDEATVDKQGNTLVGYYRWKYEFVKDILASVIELTLTAEAPQYQTILELDRKVREKTFFPHLNAFISPEDEECTPSVYMKRSMLGQYRSIALLYLHRSFFAQAMLDHPVNPLQSPFAPSFLATYRCASGIIKSSLNHYDRFPELCGRWWGIWTHLFSAAIIVGCIVTRSPSSSMASSAFIELGLACDLFEKGAMHSLRARSGLAILYKMREKAFHIYSQFRTGNGNPSKVLSVDRPDYGDDELALFGGQTRVLVSKILSSSNKRKQQQASASSPTTASTPSSDGGDSRGTPSNDLSREVHPSLVEYLSAFPPPTIPSRGSSDGALNALSEEHPAPPAIPPEQPDQQNAWQTWPLPSLFTPLPNATYNNLHTDISPFTPNPGPASGSGESGGLMDIKADPADTSLVDLGMMMTGESGMDEQWMSFMRDSGILQLDQNGMMYAGSPLPFNSNPPQTY
ncbi:fungal-specific transcription factor domain-containing protein [Flammula alnicola]|nr:fungal-specific transcription factor domain-containing protein [Flammula alnicola]